MTGGGFSAKGNLTLGGILRPRCSLWDPVGSEYLGPMTSIYIYMDSRNLLRDFRFISMVMFFPHLPGEGC